MDDVERIEELEERIDELESTVYSLEVDMPDAGDIDSRLEELERQDFDDVDSRLCDLEHHEVFDYDVPDMLTRIEGLEEQLSEKNDLIEELVELVNELKKHLTYAIT
jgi:uncharacterized coiled-coil protein SlyX